MPIKGVSEKRRLPRMGKIKLGIKVPNKGGAGEHPEETDYFVCPDIVQKAYSKKPKELVIIIPTEDEEIFFPQYLKRWGKGVLLCKGDGEKAHCWDFEQGGLKEIRCPCEHLEAKSCKPSATLKFLLPEVAESAGIFEIETGSKASIEDINSGIDYIRSITKGRIAWIPIKLIRVPMVQHRVEDKKLTASTHYPIKFSLEGLSLQALVQYTQLDPRSLLLPAADDSEPDAQPNGEDVAEEPQAAQAETEQEQAAQGIADMATSTEEEKEARKEAYRNIIITLSNGSQRKLTKFEAYKYFGNIREQLGEVIYYEVLGEFGYEHCNQMPNKKLPEVYEKLLERYALQQEEEAQEAAAADHEEEAEESEQGKLI